MRDETVQLTLAVEGGEGSDGRELDQLTTQLRRRLLDLDVNSVHPLRGEEVPEGARSAEAVTIGALLITLAPAALHSVTGLVETLIERWMDGRRIANVTLTIDGDTITLDEAPPDAHRQLVELFVARHASG